MCFQFTHLACDDWENIYFVLLSSSNRKYELLPIVAVCLFIFLEGFEEGRGEVLLKSHQQKFQEDLN